MEKVDLWEGEQVLVVDNTNGARLTTYVIKGERDSGVICMNGAAAHLINKGDEIIKSIGTIFKSGMRKQDSLARWGGEEYLFLLPETNGNQAIKLAEKLRRKIEKEAYTQDDKIFSITISIGLHQITATDTIDQAITKADTNLYMAKEQGRYRCIIN
jgi:diguanylate cyclase (GGDEF)-like protein